ncbi:MAG: hypothetical protein JKY28_04515 [Sulfurimonas sp.]|nr:hypothetical protein [Sulfurimonas sp.]PHQ92768.1 MAG: hypothetical protein COB42_00045 [Sulfurimonas sp.]
MRTILSHLYLVLLLPALLSAEIPGFEDLFDEGLVVPDKSYSNKQKENIPPRNKNINKEQNTAVQKSVYGDSSLSYIGKVEPSDKCISLVKHINKYYGEKREYMYYKYSFSYNKRIKKSFNTFKSKLRKDYHKNCYKRPHKTVAFWEKWQRSASLPAYHKFPDNTFTGW